MAVIEGKHHFGVGDLGLVDRLPNPTPPCLWSVEEDRFVGDQEGYRTVMIGSLTRSLKTQTSLVIVGGQGNSSIASLTAGRQ